MRAKQRGNLYHFYDGILCVTGHEPATGHAYGYHVNALSHHNGYICVCACLYVHSIIVTNVVTVQHLTYALMCVIMLACVDKPFLSGEIHFIISFEKLPEDYSL